MYLSVHEQAGREGGDTRWDVFGVPIRTRYYDYDDDDLE